MASESVDPNDCQVQAGSNWTPHQISIDRNQTLEKRLNDLSRQTGYSFVQANGQRQFGGPPPNWEGDQPARGSEIFVAKIPRDMLEDELFPIFEQIGRIYELRLMLDFSGSNRGFAYVKYTCSEDAKTAIEKLNNFEIRPKWRIGVALSVDNRRLYFGGIPEEKSAEDVLREVKQLTDEVKHLILYPSLEDPTKNRGYAFVEYESHRAASMARRKLIPGRAFMFGRQIIVDWADPHAEV